MKSVVLSTTEAEYIALSEVVKELKFIVQLLQTMNITVELPITVYVDNVGAIWLSNNRNTGDRTKHIDIRTAFVKEYQEDGKIIIKFVKSDDDVAEPQKNAETTKKAGKVRVTTKTIHYYEFSSDEEEEAHADPKNNEKTHTDHEKSTKKSENDQALVSNEMTPSTIGSDIFIGDSAATSHMTNNKTGVYDLKPIRGSVMIGNGESISCTHKGKLDVICKHKDGSTAKHTWEVKIVPQLNHDLFSFTKAMKEGWQMHGQWKEGGLMIELSQTSKNSIKFDRMIPSGSSWLMGLKTQRLVGQAHAVIEPGKSIPILKFHHITGHTGEHLLRPTAEY